MSTDTIARSLAWVLGRGFPTVATEEVRWFSENPSKAWGEKFFLAYTPFWIVGMALLMQSGAAATWGDWPLNTAMMLLFAPAVVVPALRRDETMLGRPWWRTYWFKFNLWIGIYAAVGSYFGSEYFFDVLGMVYNFPNLHWRVDSVLVGSGNQTVPFLMYPAAHFYFLTYHTAGVIFLRRAGNSRWSSHALFWPLAVLAAAYFFAWAETFAMAGGVIGDQFTYLDLPRMLRWGSVFYACYFVVSFPMVYRLDERAGDNWSIGRVCTDSLAAGMILLFLLDHAARIVGRMY